MKYPTTLALLGFCLLLQSPLFAQISESLQNLEGAWYQETRASIVYTIWEDKGNQTFENRIIAIVCGDTMLQSQALLRYTDEAATLMVTQNGAVQRYQLTQWDNEHLVWETEAANGLPKKLEWLFSSGGYATFIADGVETTYRKDSRRPFELKFRASAGANTNQYADPSGANRFLANASVAAVDGKTFMLPGGEVALSAGLLFPSTHLYLNFELGMAYRQVQAIASYYDSKSAGQINRDGRYQSYNYYFAMLPEVFVGKRQDLSISAGFYVDIFQQRYFRGNASLQKADAPPTLYTNLDKDIDLERGLMFGLNYRVASKEHLRPQVYLRYTHGLNTSRLRAFSLGVAVEMENH